MNHQQKDSHGENISELNKKNTKKKNNLNFLYLI